jgi:hypothetical protein
MDEEKTALDQAMEMAEKRAEDFVADEAPAPAPARLDHAMAFEMFRRAVENKSSLDPGGRVLFRTLAETDLGPLEPFPLNWEKLAQLAYQECRVASKEGKRADKVTVGVRVMEPLFTKKNRTNLIAGDRKSPMGTIIKFHMHVHELHKPWSVAEFNAFEVFRFAVDRLPERPSWLPPESEPVGG